MWNTELKSIFSSMPTLLAQQSYLMLTLLAQQVQWRLHVNKGVNLVSDQVVMCSVLQTVITADELYGDIWCFFGCFSVLNQVSSYFSCLAECCNSVLLWCSRNVQWSTTLHLTLYHQEKDRRTLYHQEKERRTSYHQEKERRTLYHQEKERRTLYHQEGGEEHWRWYLAELFL